MLLCEILLKISKALKFYPIKTVFALFVFAAWVSVFTVYFLVKWVQNCEAVLTSMKKSCEVQFIQVMINTIAFYKWYNILWKI